MGKRRFARQSNFKEEILDVVRIIEKKNNRIFFEIEDIITEDIAEAVAIMMRQKGINQTVWNKELNLDIDTIDPRKCLYWLTGGDREWVTLNNYNKPWNQCDHHFADEFEFVVRWIIKKSKTLGDIKESFIEHLSLPVLYEFAINKNLVK
jgi:hypothetical protein